MSTLAGLLCHCRMNPDGHEPGSVLDCEAPKITAGTYVSRNGSNLHAHNAGGLRSIIPTAVADGASHYGSDVHRPALDARGTCPKCGKGNVRVKRVETCGLLNGRPTSPLWIAPRLVEHRHKGVVRPGSGEVPAEIRCTPGRELARWIEEHGPDSVEHR